MRAGQRAPVSLLLSHLMQVPQGPASAPCASLGTPLQEQSLLQKPVPFPATLSEGPTSSAGTWGEGWRPHGSSGIWDKCLSNECY